ncbi:DUF4124 domain-containing protein [Aquabacterium sp.]|uniref:DUF4124 domain-containing protein n=1 Tax=Aquabacterium sp. TaxID=1872578 RepID=UPI003D6C7F5B
MKSTSPHSALLASLILASSALVATPSQAATQWKWKDASGAVQYSDRPPPAGTPDSSILQRPATSRTVQLAKPASEVDTAASAAKPPAAKASESELDVKRRKAEEDKEAQRKADEAKVAKTRADNCAQARAYQRTLSDGIRIARTNSNGEREILDDKGRADEQRRTQEAIASNCK